MTLPHFFFQISQEFGMKERHVCQPTYVYPKEVKMLLRSVFSENICDYPDPCHNNVSVKFIHDLQLLFSCSTTNEYV